MIDTSLPPHASVDAAPAAHNLRRTAAYALLTASMILLHVTMFVPAALLDCALRNGRRAAWIAAVVALPIVVIAAPVMLRFMDPQRATAYIVQVALMLMLPALVVIPHVQRTESFGRVLTLLMILAAIGFGITELGTRAIAGYSPFALEVADMRVAADLAVKQYQSANMPPEFIDIARRAYGYAASNLVPSLLVVNAGTAFLLSLLMVGRLSAWRKRYEGATEAIYRFRELVVPEWMLFAFVVGGLAPLTTGLAHQIVANVLAVAVFLFLAQGFALFRFMLAAMGIGFLGAMIASVLVIFSGIGMFLLAIAGLFDPFFDFRHFKKRKDDSHESHSD
ncbi:MAG: DUF2232 domain-containing protein [Thermoanaerobaculia bacterium]